MPYRMHSEYLRRLFLDNDLASGRYLVNRRPVAIRNICAPMFAVGTERDRIAPWRSVYKIHNVSDTEVTFVLTSDGHNAGIVSEPGHPHRHFRMKLSAADDLRIGPDEWDGSWWPMWSEWLTAGSRHIPVCSAWHRRQSHSTRTVMLSRMRPAFMFFKPRRHA
jgi:polyhydroxyalkanoate synthase